MDDEKENMTTAWLADWLTTCSRLVQNLRATPEFPCLLWNPEVHCHVHNSLPFVIDETGSHNCIIFSIYILVLSSNLRLRFSYGLFPSRFPIKPCTQVSSPPACHMFRYRLFFHRLSNMGLGEQTMKFSHEIISSLFFFGLTLRHKYHSQSPILASRHIFISWMTEIW